MWLGEQISERGIGNGMSLIIFAGIVVGFAACREQKSTPNWQRNNGLPSWLSFLLAMMVAVVAFIVLVERAQQDEFPCSMPNGWWAASHGWTVDAPAVEGERGRRDPGDLCLLHPGFSANLRLAFPGSRSSGT